MIGFVVTPEQAQAAAEAVAAVQIAHGSPVFWQPGAYPIHSGEHAGQYFIPCDTSILSTPLTGSPVKTPPDYAEFIFIIESMGGLDARIDIDPSIITSSSEP
jgi:hypothetical protein